MHLLILTCGFMTWLSPWLRSVVVSLIIAELALMTILDVDKFERMEEVRK